MKKDVNSLLHLVFFLPKLCADPGIFVGGGGGGGEWGGGEWGGGGAGPCQTDKKNSDNVSFCPQLILQMSNGHFSRFQRGSNIFQGGGGVQLLPGGPIACLFPIDTHITYNFQGGSGPPVPPLDPHLDVVLKSIFCNMCPDIGSNEFPMSIWLKKPKIYLKASNFYNFPS